jgi:hypothetical protein
VFRKTKRTTTTQHQKLEIIVLHKISSAQPYASNQRAPRIFRKRQVLKISKPPDFEGGPDTSTYTAVLIQDEATSSFGSINDFDSAMPEVLGIRASQHSHPVVAKSGQPMKQQIIGTARFRKDRKTKSPVIQYLKVLVTYADASFCPLHDSSGPRTQ